MVQYYLLSRYSLFVDVTRHVSSVLTWYLTDGLRALHILALLGIGVIFLAEGDWCALLLKLVIGGQANLCGPLENTMKPICD